MKKNEAGLVISAKQTEVYLSNSVDLIAEHLAVTLGTALSQSLATFATSAHCMIFGFRQPPQLGNRKTVGTGGLNVNQHMFMIYFFVCSKGI